MKFAECMNVLLQIWYDKYSNISNISRSGWLIIRAGRQKMLSETQTVKTLIRLFDLGLHGLSWHFGLATNVQNFRTFTVNGLSVK